jgi:hypothetical protein
MLASSIERDDQKNGQEKGNVKITICKKKKKDEQERNNKEIF